MPREAGSPLSGEQVTEKSRTNQRSSILVSRPETSVMFRLLPVVTTEISNHLVTRESGACLRNAHACEIRPSTVAASSVAVDAVTAPGFNVPRNRCPPNVQK